MANVWHAVDTMAVVVITQCKLPKALAATPVLYPIFVVTLQCERPTSNVE